MRAREKVELALMPVVIATVGLAGERLPTRVSVGALLVAGCLGWLVQGGLRDLWLLYLTKTRTEHAPRRKMACMCVESSVGLAGLMFGLVLMALGLGGELTMNPTRWMIFLAAVLVIGFLAKDYVVTWRPLGVRREPEHHTFIFTWR